jgi:hypothetical protein
MSFAIDDAKVKKLLESSPTDYESPSGSPLNVGIDNYTNTPIYPSLPAGGTIPEGTREHLLALRRKIEESGTPLISADELESEIREMRR